MSQPKKAKNPNRLQAMAKESMSDVVTYVERAKTGDTKAFEQLVKVTYRDAYTLAFRLLNNAEDASDAVQEAYLNAYKGISNFRGDAHFNTWMHRIVVNCSITLLRKRKAMQSMHSGELDVNELVDTGACNDPSKNSAVLELHERLEIAIHDLPPRLRAVVVLRDIYAMPYSVIASELSISVIAAKVRLHRARRRLREKVMPLVDENGGNFSRSDDEDGKFQDGRSRCINRKTMSGQQTDMSNHRETVKPKSSKVDKAKLSHSPTWQHLIVKSM